MVRRIFRLCLEGMPTRAIARLLTQERVPSKHDRHPALAGRKAAGAGEWHANTIPGLLRYEGYIGRMYYNKQKAAGKTRRTDRPRDEWVQVGIPTIIGDDVFQAVQDQLARNKALAQRNRKYDYLFVGGRLHCGRCGRAMTGEAPHGVRRYRCSSRMTFADPSKRCKVYVNANGAEGRVWQAIEQVLQQPEIITAEVNRQQAGAEEQRTEILRDISRIEDTLATCDREEQRWAQAYVAEVINLEELKG